MKMMKRLLILLILTALAAGEAFAQKMVIGSRIPDFKGVQWLTVAPAGPGSSQTAPMLIEFYNPDNASSVRFFPKLADVKSRHGNGASGVQIVVLVAQSGPAADKLRQDYGDKYYIGVDPDGKVYQSFNVRFLPYTILVNSKGELYWQGNLGNLTDEVLRKVR